MSLTNIDLINKNRLRAFLKAQKTITRKKRLNERYKLLEVLIRKEQSKLFNFYLIEFHPVEKKLEEI